MKISPANTWLFLQKLLSHYKDSVINIVVLKDYRSDQLQRNAKISRHRLFKCKCRSTRDRFHLMNIDTTGGGI